MTPLRVSELNRLARLAIEREFPLLWVCGEVSNLTVAASGHAYFTLKDEAASVRCVMFRSRAQLIGWRLTNGDRVEAQVIVSLYEARGDFQLNVEALRRAGSGNLHEAFLRIKEKLEREGLFDPAKKRPLPAFPRRLGVVTSAQGAALRDVVSTLARRGPHLEIVLYASAVQGAQAPAELVAAIDTASARAARDGCELLIVCRGGGSLEDLWAFNDEAVARAIRRCSIPVVCGVGHETDFTIADFAADLRAPTPTGAAELAAPAREAVWQRLDELAAHLRGRLARRVETFRYRLELARASLKHPAERLRERRATLALVGERLRHARHRTLNRHQVALDRLGERLSRQRPEPSRYAARIARLQGNLDNATYRRVDAWRSSLALQAARLNALDPRSVLARGYAMVTDRHGRLVNNAMGVELGDTLDVNLASGRLRAEVVARHAGDPEQETQPSPTIP